LSLLELSEFLASVYSLFLELFGFVIELLGLPRFFALLALRQVSLQLCNATIVLALLILKTLFELTLSGVRSGELLEKSFVVRISRGGGVGENDTGRE
jgi:hypothetical protein